MVQTYTKYKILLRRLNFIFEAILQSRENFSIFIYISVLVKLRKKIKSQLQVRNSTESDQRRIKSLTKRSPRRQTKKCCGPSKTF